MSPRSGPRHTVFCKQSVEVQEQVQVEFVQAHVWFPPKQGGWQSTVLHALRPVERADYIINIISNRWWGLTSPASHGPGSHMARDIGAIRRNNFTSPRVTAMFRSP